MLWRMGLESLEVMMMLGVVGEVLSSGCDVVDDAYGTSGASLLLLLLL